MKWGQAPILCRGLIHQTHLLDFTNLFVIKKGPVRIIIVSRVARSRPQACHSYRKLSTGFARETLSIFHPILRKASVRARIEARIKIPIPGVVR